MSTRISRLYSLPLRLYSTGLPVVVESGSLYRDNVTGKLLVQVKYRNITEREIVMLSVKFITINTEGKKDSFEFWYTDLHAKRDDIFGDKTPIFLADNTIKAFAINIKEVAYEDMFLAKFETTENFQALPANVKTGDNTYLPVKTKDLWICECGGINHRDEVSCHNCKKDYRLVFSLAPRYKAESKTNEVKKSEPVKKETVKTETVVETKPVETKKTEEIKTKTEEKKSTVKVEQPTNVIKQESVENKVNEAIDDALSILGNDLNTDQLIDDAINEIENPEPTSEEIMKTIENFEPYDFTSEIVDDVLENDFQFESNDKTIQMNVVGKENADQPVTDKKEKKSLWKKLTGLFSIVAIMSVVIVSSLWAAGVISFDSKEYRNAVKAYNSGDYNSAIEQFSVIDSQSAQDYLVKSEIELIRTAPVTGTVSFGNIDGIPLKWKVVEVNSNNIVLLLQSSIASMPFSKDGNEWESSDVRKFLNYEFYEQFFITSEKERILPIDLDTTNKYGELTKTTDYVFLASKEEIESYGLYVTKTDFTYLLRDLGQSENCVLAINNYGEAIEISASENGEIRPLICVITK